MQDQEREVQSESVEDCEEVQEEVQEGPQEGTAPVPEDLLRARLADLLMPFHQVRAGYRSGDLPLSPRFELLSRTGSSYLSQRGSRLCVKSDQRGSDGVGDCPCLS